MHWAAKSVAGRKTAASSARCLVEKLRTSVDIVAVSVQQQPEGVLAIKTSKATCVHREKREGSGLRHRGRDMGRCKACPKQPARACLRLFRVGPKRDVVVADRRIREWFEPFGPQLVVCHEQCILPQRSSS